MILLTDREYQIAGCIAADLSEKMIAEKLFISPGTVHTHKKNIRKKWNVKSAVGIAVKYILQLEEPKKFAIAMLFISLQFSMVFYNNQFEIRKVKKARNSIKIMKYEY